MGLGIPLITSPKSRSRKVRGKRASSLLVELEALLIRVDCDRINNNPKEGTLWICLSINLSSR